MATERAPELERLIEQISGHGKQGDVDTLERTLSHDPALLIVGTARTEIWEGRDEIIEGARTEMERVGEESDFESIQDERRGYRAGDVGWVFVQGKYRIADGSEIPTRGVVILRREGGDWKVVQSFYSIAVPNSALEVGSPLGEALSDATR